MQRIIVGTAIAMSMAFGGVRIVQGSRPALQTTAALARKPVIDWSNEVRRAIVPPGRNGIFGPENYGDKFPGEGQSTWASSTPRYTTWRLPSTVGTVRMRLR